MPETTQTPAPPPENPAAGKTPKTGHRTKTPTPDDPHKVPSGMTLAEHFRRHHTITDQHLAACRANLPKDAIQEARAADTGKKYDSTGFGYQWVADRLSDVFGPDGWTEDHQNLETKGTWGQRKTTFYHITCHMTLMVGHWIITQPDGEGVLPAPVFAPVGSWQQYGEHRAGNRGDARKGAHTNALKKVAALGLGIGASAFRGSIDEDMAGARPPDSNAGRQPADPPATPQQAAERQRADTSWGEPRTMQATKAGTCSQCHGEILPGQWIVWPVPDPLTGKRSAMHARCYDVAYPQPDGGRTGPSAADNGRGHASGPPPSSAPPQAPPGGQAAPSGEPAPGNGDDDPDDDLPF